MAITYRFQSKTARDEFCRANPGFRKRSSRSVVLSPDYVRDYSGARSDNGFGGSQPQYFGVLYVAEKR